MSDPQFRSLINLRQLEVLRAVMRCRTTIGAAEELGMSQPAVSNAIKLAETKLGIALFDRVSNRLVPTADARILMADAEPLFVVHEAVQRKLERHYGKGYAPMQKKAPAAGVPVPA
ncbi:MAG TPA: LysR family transcriptional regulator [Variovorax sp.]|nr:LysR family transcriptional regulator [Variovorax sp.]